MVRMTKTESQVSTLLKQFPMLRDCIPCSLELMVKQDIIRVKTSGDLQAMLFPKLIWSQWGQQYTEDNIVSICHLGKEQTVPWVYFDVMPTEFRLSVRNNLSQDMDLSQERYLTGGWYPFGEVIANHELTTKGILYVTHFSDLCYDYGDGSVTRLRKLIIYDNSVVRVPPRSHMWVTVYDSTTE